MAALSAWPPGTIYFTQMPFAHLAPAQYIQIAPEYLPQAIALPHALIQAPPQVKNAHSKDFSFFFCHRFSRESCLSSSSFLPFSPFKI
eukprot:m.38536 g.38536  ORF g.38536 m.38536 type:complete len:88 (-) comp10001_c0_seq2:666-929(-)